MGTFRYKHEFSENIFYFMSDLLICVYYSKTLAKTNHWISMAAIKIVIQIVGLAHFNVRNYFIQVIDYNK